jgi:hypothetical protein
MSFKRLGVAGSFSSSLAFRIIAVTEYVFVLK